MKADIEYVSPGESRQEIKIHRYREGIGWEITMPTLEKALEAHRTLLKELGSEPGWYKEKK